MHIGFLIGSDSWGGLEMNQVKSARWMMESGMQVSVISVNNPRIIAFCREYNIPHLLIPPHKKYYDFKASRILRKLIKQYEIKHLIIRDVRDMSTTALARFWSKKAFRLHYFMEMQLGVKKTNPLHTLRFAQLDTWSCPLHWLQDQVNIMTHMKSNRVIHIPSPMDTEPFRFAVSKQEARKLMDLPEESFLVGLAGRFDPQKGQLLLLEALAKNPNKTIEILFLGEPTANEGMGYYEKMQDLIAQMELTNRIYIRPFRNDIQVFYKAIDVFVMASKAETVGMVTLEALASSCPVIGSNAGGTPEILDFGKRGYLFETQNSDSLSEQLTQALQQTKKLDWDTIQLYIHTYDYHEVIPQVILRLQQFNV